MTNNSSVVCFTAHTNKPCYSPLTTKTPWKKWRVLISDCIAGVWHTVVILTSSNEQSRDCRCDRLKLNVALSGRLFLIYFTYTCSDIHIISCCDTLTPDSGRFIQTIHANLHSYHARMGRAGRQRSSLWPKRANTQAKNMLGRNTKNSLKAFSHLQKLMIPHQHVTQLIHEWMTSWGHFSTVSADELKEHLCKKLFCFFF